MKTRNLFGVLMLTVLFAGRAAHGDETRDRFDGHFRQAQALFKQDKLAEAYAAVQAAGRIDPSRYEASGLAALILLKNGKITAASEALADARRLAPPEATKKLDDIGRLIETVTAATARSGKSRRDYEMLRLIIAEADQATSPEQRQKRLREFMRKSAEFIVDNPAQTNVWILRAAACLELDNRFSGWLAGRRLQELGGELSADPAMVKILAKLDRKRWLGESPEREDWRKLPDHQVLQMANDGDESAQNYLGEAYNNGYGRTKDVAQALSWYRKSAEQGHAHSQFWLANHFSGVTYLASDNRPPRDEKLMLFWLHRSAAQSFPPALQSLANVYLRGEGVTRDVSKANYLQLKAAQHGDTRAQVELAKRLIAGQDIPRDVQQGLSWWRRVAERPVFVWEKNSLAWLLATAPEADVRNGKEAVRWGREACEAMNWTNHLYLDTLAAAYAEAGGFDLAVDYAGKAIRLLDANDSVTRHNLEHRLKLYQTRKPFHRLADGTQAGARFREENKKKPGVTVKAVRLPDGTMGELQYEVIKTGSGSSPRTNDVVRLSYWTTSPEGLAFDRKTSTRMRMSELIVGGREALQMMNVGAKWRVVIPPQLAYDKRSARELPPNSTLICEFELLGIEPPQ